MYHFNELKIENKYLQTFCLWSCAINTQKSNIDTELRNDKM